MTQIQPQTQTQTQTIPMTISLQIETEMPRNGNYSFKTGKTRNIKFENGMKIRLERGNAFFARLDFVDNTGNIIPIPNGISLIDLETNVEETKPFIIIWTQTYALRLNGNNLMKIINQKQSDIFGGSEFYPDVRNLLLE